MKVTLMVIAGAASAPKFWKLVILFQIYSYSYYIQNVYDTVSVYVLEVGRERASMDVYLKGKRIEKKLRLHFQTESAFISWKQRFW